MTHCEQMHFYCAIYSVLNAWSDTLISFGFKFSFLFLYKKKIFRALENVSVMKQHRHVSE